MAIVDFLGGMWWPSPIISNLSGLSFSALTLDASGERQAFVIVAPKDGTLDTFEFRTNAVSNNPDNGIRISFQDLDSNGNPDGTQDQFRDIAGPFSANTWVVPGLITSDGTDTGTKRTVNAGDRFAVVFEFVSFVASDNIQIAGTNVNIASTGRTEGTLIYTDFFSGASWTKGGILEGYPNGALKYDDGYYPINTMIVPASALNTRSYANNNTPDERALRFQVPVQCECSGCWLRCEPDADVDVVLYDSDGSTVLRSYSLTSAARLTANGAIVFISWDPVTLSASTTYRISFKPTTTSGVILYTYSVDSNALFAAAQGGVEWYSSEQTDAGGWTDVDTERPFIGLLITGVETSGSGGGGEHSAVF